TESYFVFSVGM
uniref:Antimicrobial peptide 2 n=1 Tax=Cocos nucifera TaxID=13894 RepID=AMP2_COCNU|nr:RecName: Full=Antimicrobial peptide 2; Short=Cn-AMP2 [Cocos nucifera]